MDRRDARWVVLGWTLLGMNLGGLGSIAERAWHTTQQREARRAPPAPAPRPPENPARKPSLTFEECRAAIRNGKDLETWDAAVRACQTARGMPSPIEIHDLLRDAVRESNCAKSLSAATDATRRKELERVPELLRWYDPHCRDADEARELLLRALDAVEGPDAAACLEAAKKGDWVSAYQPCAHAFDNGCWKLPDDDLGPPEGKTVALWGRLPANGWRPAWNVHRALMQAEEKDGIPHDEGCAMRPLLLENAAELTVAYASVRTRLRERFPNEHAIAVALEDYHRGKLDEAQHALQRLGAWSGQESAGHQQAGHLAGDLMTARAAYRSGLEALMDGDLGNAAARFRHALNADARVVLSEQELEGSAEVREALLRTSPSFLRQSIIESMQRRALERGTLLAGQSDWEGACKAYRLGLGFGPSDALERSVAKGCAPRSL